MTTTMQRFTIFYIHFFVGGNFKFRIRVCFVKLLEMSLLFVFKMPTNAIDLLISTLTKMALHSKCELVNDCKYKRMLYVVKFFCCCTNNQRNGIRNFSNFSTFCLRRKKSLFLAFMMICAIEYFWSNKRIKYKSTQLFTENGEYPSGSHEEVCFQTSILHILHCHRNSRQDGAGHTQVTKVTKVLMHFNNLTCCFHSFY